MSQRSLEDLLASAASPVELLRNSQAGPNVYPGVPAEYTNWRDETQAWQRTCVLFNQSYHMADLAVVRPRRGAAALRSRRQQLQRLRRRQGEALRAVHAGGLRDRRRDPVCARRELVQPRRPRARAELDHVPRGDRRLRRRGRARPAHRAAHRRAAQVVSLPGAGPERDEGDREGARRHAARAEVLQHDDGDDRGQDRPRAPSRHGRPAGLGALRPVGRRRRGARRARHGRRGVRTAAGRRPRVLGEHARVGLDPVAASGGLLRREPEVVPRVAAGRRLRGPRVDRRQLRRAGDRGLLLHAVGSRLRELRQVRPRLHRPRRAREDGGRAAPPEGHARARRRRRHAHDRDDAPEERPREVHRLAVRGLLDASVRPRHGRRRDRRCLDLGRLQRERGQDAHARGRSTRSTPSPAPRSRSSGARRTAARRSRPSSGTSRRRCAPSSARFRTSRPCARRTPPPEAGARRASLQRRAASCRGSCPRPSRRSSSSARACSTA